MSIRTKLLVLFAALALIPLLAIGVVDYVRSLRALEEVFASQTSVIARQAADEVSERFGMVAANLSLLAANSAAADWVRHAQPDDTRGFADSTYQGQLRAATRRYFARVTYRRIASGAVMYLLDDSESERERSYVLTAPIHVDGAVAGFVDAAVRVDSLISRNAIEARFGRSGWTALMDSLLQTALLTDDVARLGDFVNVSWRETDRAADGGGRIKFALADSSYIATVARPIGAPFVVVAAGNLDEFGGPFARIRASNLVAVFTTTALAALLFLVFLWRATGSLTALTAAADQVGAGNLNPSLPPGGRDEVGRLSLAFAHMVARVRDTLAEMERARKMAAVGEFASQISHEIRNPLTSIKLNLQTIDRAAKAGVVPPELQPPVSISLREIDRLDRVVRGVLQLGRGKPGGVSRFRLNEAAVSAAECMRPALERNAIELSIEDNSNGHSVQADRSLIEAAVINLLVNAVEAMPRGGSVRITTADAERDGAAVARLRIEDTGAGVSAADRDRVFAPFFSTKPEGTGLGLALANRTAEEHAGRLWAEARSDGAPGAAFVLELPLAIGTT